MRTLSVGIDLVEIARIARMLDQHGDRAVRRLLVGEEREYCLGKARPAQHVAARVAAKEASYKALQAAGEAAAVDWLDIEVLNGEGGRPSVRFHGRAQAAAERLGVRETHLSLSHSQDTAIAVVLLNG